MGSLYNYRLWLLQYGGSGVVEPSDDVVHVSPAPKRLTIFGHGLAGLGAGWTRLAPW